MPELPEVETVKNGLIPFMAGKAIAKLELRREGLRTPFTPKMADRIKGGVIERLERRAKYILIHLEGGDMVVMHLGMSGRVSTKATLKGYVPAKHDHVLFHMAGGGGVVFSDPRRFGMLFLIKQSEYETHPAFKDLGPEPLSNGFSGPVLYERLRAKNMPVKIALLDQRIVAGIGNIYASEALHQAGIHPQIPSSSLTPGHAEKLAAAVRDVLMRAIAAGGSTLKDYRQSDGSLGYFQHGFKVYGKEGEPCPVCAPNGRKKAVIEKIVQGGRATFFCRHCQK